MKEIGETSSVQFQEEPMEEVNLNPNPNLRAIRDFALPNTIGSQTTIAMPLVNTKLNIDLTLGRSIVTKL